MHKMLIDCYRRWTYVQIIILQTVWLVGINVKKSDVEIIYRISLEIFLKRVVTHDDVKFSIRLFL